MRPLHRFAASRRKHLPREPAAPSRPPTQPSQSRPARGQLSDTPSLDVVFQALENDLRLPLDAVGDAVAAAAIQVKKEGEALDLIESHATGITAAGEGALAEAANLTASAQALETASAEIASSVVLATQTVSEAASSARSGRMFMKDLAAGIEEIGGVGEVITAVARQANLLALNATIEAARAGPAGQEFARLAREMEALSVETGKAANDIRLRIAKLRENAGSSVRVAEKVASLMQDVESVFDRVRTAVTDQHASVKEVGQQATALSHSVEKLTRSGQDMHAIAAEAGKRALLAEESTTSAEGLVRALRGRLMTVVRQNEMGDRRRHDRFPVHLNVALHVGAHSLATHTLDISVGGMLLANLHAISLPSGYPLDVDVEGIGRFGARVAAVSPLGLHCAFTQLDLDAQSQLTQLIGDIEAEYRPLIALANRTARRIETTFEQTVAERRLTREQLFDCNYRPIPKTDPRQYETAYTFVLEGLLPAIQEPLLAADNRLFFAIAIDRNGYVPVHNRTYSQAQRAGEPAWNAVNCRHKRIFDGRVDLIAARSTRPFAIQTYVGETADGGTASIRDVAVPIQVFGRHWGAFRMAYQL